jgi:hypothetical protein
MTSEEIEKAWLKLKKELEEKFQYPIDIQGALFLVGVRELGAHKSKFTKDQKMDLMHIAVCRLLSDFGYYELIGLDNEGWPHYKRIKKLPPLNGYEQDLLIKQSLIQYMEAL